MCLVFPFSIGGFPIFCIFSSFQEWANAMERRPSSVRPSVCKLLRKSLFLADKWPDRHQTCTRWTPGQRASRVCSRSRSRSRSKVTWYAHFFGFLEWATPSLTVWFVVIFMFLQQTYPSFIFKTRDMIKSIQIKAGTTRQETALILYCYDEYYNKL